MTPRPDLRDAILEAASRTLEGDLVTRFVACFEVIGSDGEQVLVTTANRGAAGWDTLGMLEFAAQIERASIQGTQ